MREKKPVGAATSIPLRCLFAAVLVVHAIAAVAAEVDFSGVWMPDDRAATQWSVGSVPFTPRGAAEFRGFDPRKGDSVRYCMPFGTPRNTLSTAPRPIEILQRPEQITLLFDGMNDVRRIHLDGRAHPRDALASWMGHSIGSWQGAVLRVDTVATNHESILDESGLPHSDKARITERLRVEIVRGRKTLIDDILIDDPLYYREPLRATRQFVWAPAAAMSEGSSLCLLDQWRQRLEQLNKELTDKKDSTVVSQERRQ